jgi:uncharacterized membrane protein
MQAHHGGDERHERGGGLARGLGWFSIALGVAELAAPRQMARLIGLRADEQDCATLRACGIREITSGVGILAQPHSSGWLWSRVGGNAMDLAVLGRALGEPGTRRDRLIAAGVAVAGVTLLDLLAAQRHATSEARFLPLDERRAAGRLSHRPVALHATVTIRRPAKELYRYWRDVENLPDIMTHLESVQATGARTSHWKARAAGVSLEWDAEIVKDEPDQLIGWASLAGSEITHAGSVRFRPAPGGRGTEVVVELFFDPPAGPLGRAVARMLRSLTAAQLERDLREFKQVMELGEVMRSDASLERRLTAARPPARDVEPSIPVVEQTLRPGL